MQNVTWQKSANTRKQKEKNGSESIKFILGGMLLIAVVAYLIVTGTTSGARFFVTVNDVVSNPAYLGDSVRVSGAVIGETIDYDTENLIIEFEIANIPQEFDNLAIALHDAVNSPDAARMKVHIEGEVMPDLLQNEAQAILTGELHEDGIFYASELLLKCPSRFEETGLEVESKPHGS